MGFFVGFPFFSFLIFWREGGGGGGGGGEVKEMLVLLITFADIFDPDQIQLNVWSGLDPNS